MLGHTKWGIILSNYVLSVEQKPNSETLGKNRGDAKRAHKKITCEVAFCVVPRLTGALKRIQKDPYAFIRQSNQPYIFHTLVSQIFRKLGYTASWMGSVVLT